VAAVWGYVGPLITEPSQTSSPPITCGVYGLGGVVGVNGFTGTIADPDAGGDGVIGFGSVNGVHGIGDAGTGVAGTSNSGKGVYGKSDTGIAVVGISTSNAGVDGSSTSSFGVAGTSKSGTGVGGKTTSGVAVYGESDGSGMAGKFQGAVEIDGATTINGAAKFTGDVEIGTKSQNNNVAIHGDITSVNTITVANDVVLTGGHDCAEQFDTLGAVAIMPGTIVVIDDSGTLRESQSAYDRRVAGVVSGAGDFKPGIVLGQPAASGGSVAVALVGRVYCKVDADPAPIAVGDLLTTSARPGFAMKAVDPSRAFGAVLGKALLPLPDGQGMIPILVALQ
jgi:hypothetical protein